MPAGASNGSPGDVTYLSYSGLGAVLASERIEQGTTNWETEEFRVDALGNVLRSRSESRDFNNNLALSSTYSRRGALQKRGSDYDPDFQLHFDSTAQSVDFDGNVVQFDHTARDRAGHYTTDAPSRSYFGYDGKLRAVQRYNYVPADSSQAGTWEEYRYDPFGRRVMVISRRAGTPPGCSGITFCAALCTVSGCDNTVTWTMYDGSQLVEEERRPYPDGALGGANTGIVEYVHGLELDRPLAIVNGGAVFVPNPNWRGTFESSVTPTGNGADCSLTGGTCPTIAWPAGHRVYARPVPFTNAGTITFTWLGSLATDQQDGTGQLFRRNRYYDPDAGRFTQEDPIGLAGGMNLYGFAGGDAVNFSDPFGTCKIQVGYTRVVGPFRHAFIVMTPPDATATVYRGGPTNQSSGASASGASKGSSESGSSGSSGGNMSAFGPIKVVDPQQWSPQDRDSERAVAYDKPLVDDDESCDKYQQSFAATMNRINGKKIMHDPLANNSNSVAKHASTQSRH